MSALFLSTFQPKIGAMEKLELDKKPDKTVNTVKDCGETLDKFSNYQYAPSAPSADNADILLKLHNGNVLFNKNGTHQNGNHQLRQLHKNNLSLGDSNYNERSRKSSLPDIS